MACATDNKTAAAPKCTWPVVVVYEDTAAREAAVKFCDLLIERFWASSGFEVGWWSFASLEDEASAREALEKATEAPLIVFATRPEGALPDTVKAWIETCMSRRGDREGALVGLMDPGAGLSRALADKYVYLRTLAHKGAMDYLTELPETIARVISESMESYTERAHQVTSVLDEILHQPAPPSHLAF
jgi:hypothetical protein